MDNLLAAVLEAINVLRWLVPRLVKILVSILTPIAGVLFLSYLVLFKGWDHVWA